MSVADVLPKSPDDPFFDLMWFLPLMYGVVAVGYAGYALLTRERIVTVMTCFALAVALLGLGAYCTWLGGREMWIALALEENAFEVHRRAWSASWTPLQIAIGFTAVLLAIGVTGRFSASWPRRRPIGIPRAYAMAIPLAVVLAAFLISTALHLSNARAPASIALPLRAILEPASYLLAILGLPYILLWRQEIRRERQAAHEGQKARLLNAFFVLCTIATVIWVVSWFPLWLQGYPPSL